MKADEMNFDVLGTNNHQGPITGVNQIVTTTWDGIRYVMTRWGCCNNSRPLVTVAYNMAYAASSDCD